MCLCCVHKHCPFLPPIPCNSVRLHIYIVVLACPNKPSLSLQALCHHVVNETVLVPNTCLLKLLLVLTAEGRGEEGERGGGGEESRGGGEWRRSECDGVSCEEVRREVGWRCYF